MRHLLLGTVLLAACSFNSGGVGMEDGGAQAVDATVLSYDADDWFPDAAPPADADPNAPDATPSPDSSVVLPPDASVVLPPDASVVLPPDASVVLPPDASVVLPPDAGFSLPPDASSGPDAMCTACDDGADCTIDTCNSLGGAPCTYVDTCGAGTVCNVPQNRCEGKITLRQGLDGYTGTQDSFVSEASPNATNGNRNRIEWDADDPFMSGDEKLGLLRFDGFVGGALDQIPTGATVLSATLTLAVVDGSDGPEEAAMHTVLVDWSESTVSYANFGGDSGINADEISASSVAKIPATPCGFAGCPVVIQVDVTSSVQGWVTSPATNFGWAIMPGAFDGTDVASRNAGRSDLRPSLSILYAVAP